MVTDHKGNNFETVQKMCKNYNISVQTYYRRKKKGLSLEECLSTKYRDHLGNEFITIEEMCKYHGVSCSKFRKYKNELQLSLEECLSKKKPLKYEDHLGNKFSSLQDMLAFHGVGYTTWKYRVDLNLPLSMCLARKE